jgi:hypothetical protein
MSGRSASFPIDDAGLATVIVPRGLLMTALSTVLCGEVAAAERYAAQFQDGSRAEEAEVRAWHDVDARPTIAGRPFLDPGNPARWIIDRQQPPADPPDAYVEFTGGDRLAGTVVGVQTGQENPYDQRPPHLLVRPAADLHDPDDKMPSELRVGTEWVRRIVWRHRGRDEYRPATALLRNGGAVAYRAVRWDKEGPQLLTDDGVRTLAWDELAALHLPPLDSWSSYFDQLAVLSPSCTARMIQLETANGSRFTTSLERFRARNWGDANRPDTWHHLIQPAWAFDPLWVRYRTIRAWRFFQPDVVPLTLIAPAAVEQRSVFGAGWTWQVDRNVQRGPLRSAQLEFAWGFGVQATTELRFEYPPLARALRTQAGLDHAAGEGGCVNLAVLDGTARPLFRAEHLIGSTRIVDTGWLNLPQEDTTPRHVVLRADLNHNQRPPGADPFDIRDAVNWYEPELKLELPLLQAEVARRGSSRLPGLLGWTVPAGDAEQMQLANVLDAHDPRRPEFRLKFLAKDRFVTFSRRLKIGPQHRWLAAVITRDHEQTTPASVQIRIDGRVLGDLDVPLQQGPLEPDPLVVPLDGYQGKTVLVELIILPHGEQSYVDVRGVTLSADRPGVLRLFEDQPEFARALTTGSQPTVTVSVDQPFSGTHALKISGGSAENGALPGVDAWIMEQPRIGQYRFLVFAWKKEGGNRIVLQLAHDGRFAEQIVQLVQAGERPGRRRFGPFDPRRMLEDRSVRYGFSYDAGTETPLVNAPLRIDSKIPDQWTFVTRDVFIDFGPLHLTGLSLGCPDGNAAWFDHLYLARTPHDVDFLRTWLVNPQLPPAPDGEANVALKMAKREDYGRLLSRMAPQFGSAAIPGGLALLREHAGQVDALRTSPVDQDTPCILRAAVALPADKACYLDARVSHVPQHDWRLVVKANGEAIHDQLIHDALTTPQRGWASVQIDLSRFAGQKVLLEVLNQSNDARNETAYWKRLTIEER